VENSVLAAVKQKVILARELDQLELAARRSNCETGWFRKALTEMDMLIDEENLYPLSYMFSLHIITFMLYIGTYNMNCMVYSSLFGCRLSMHVSFINLPSI
jgi:hypothetical protein